ncbi:MAG TPA: hypothetical protein EYH45_02080, partial [Candidatus Caldiarchaeum subterraneum]|nr:hypothetical protein [Candidatus Caldarchaeum subterraneum]
MQYYMAVRIGEERSAKSQLRLMKYVTPAMAAMFVKKRGEGDFEPVGEEDFYAVVDTPQEGMCIVAICDSEGYAKAITNPIPKGQARAVIAQMKRDGIEEYKGKP